MKIPMMFCNREVVGLLLAFHSAVRHLKIGFKELFICAIFAIPFILLTILDSLFRSKIWTKKKN